MNRTVSRTEVEREARIYKSNADAVRVLGIAPTRFSGICCDTGSRHFTRSLAACGRSTSKMTQTDAWN